MTKKSRRITTYLLFFEHSEKCLGYFFHQSNHNLLMGESFLTFLVVVNLEVEIALDDSCSHQVEVFMQTSVPSFCDSLYFENVARHINTGVGATEGDEILVALKGDDGSIFGKKMSCGNFASTSDDYVVLFAPRNNILKNLTNIRTIYT